MENNSLNTTFYFITFSYFNNVLVIVSTYSNPNVKLYFLKNLISYTLYYY